MQRKFTEVRWRGVKENRINVCPILLYKKIHFHFITRFPEYNLHVKYPTCKQKYTLLMNILLLLLLIK